MKYRYFALIVVLILGCSPGEKQEAATSENNSETKSEKPSMKVENLDIQGHRGARGILPENSIVGFKRAWKIGATTLSPLTGQSLFYS